MKKNNTIKHFCLILLLAYFFVLSSCANLFNSSVKDKNAAKKTYLSVNVGRIKAARTVNPASMPIESVLPLFSDFTLTGVFDATGELFTFLEAVPSVTELAASKIEVSAGKWEFTLSGSFNGIVFKGSQVIVIKEGEENIISFVLNASENYGGYSITFDLAGSSVSQAEAILQKKDGTIIEEKTQAVQENKIVLSRNITDSAKRLESGTYLLSVKFYADEDKTILLNNWENYIAIQSGVMTTANITLDFNELYTITYDYDGGELAEGFETSKYSANSFFDLPVAKKTGYLFLGWYEEVGGSLSSDQTSEITKGTIGNKSFVAKYQSTSIYVSASGDDDTGDGSSSNTFKTINKGCELIEAYGVADTEWTIYVNGTLTTSESQTIPDTITEDVAASILITGVNTGVIDRGSTGNYNGSATSSVITINTAVPVTIENLEITGGNTGNGGGINIAEGATVFLGDGVLIIKNRATYGGAIFNQGDLFIYGSAVIGDENATSPGNGDYTQNLVDTNDAFISANFANNGGGIYNGDTANTVGDTKITAHLYLGYKLAADGITLEKKTWTGGIYKSGAKIGGGIYNARKSTVTFASGTIKYNGIQQYGAGIYNCASSRLEMHGGEIINNTTSYSSSVMNGGGVCNHYTDSVFVMSGGLINGNTAVCTGTSSDGKGGGVYNGGKMYMYGTAVIGNSSANSVATATTFGNEANIGGGIFNDNSTDSAGKLYIGYKQSSSGTSYEEADFSGGIYQNYSHLNSSTSKWGGGGLYNYSTCLIAGGTIAYNSTADYGGGIWSKDLTISGGTIRDNNADVFGSAIYMYSGDYLSLGGTFDIPKGASDSHDIYLEGTSAIKITSDLDGNLEAIVTPESYTQGKQLITGSSVNLATEVLCFAVSDEEDSTQWKINESGKLTPKNPFASVTVTLCDPDLEVSIKSNGIDILDEGTITLTGTETLVFEAETGLSDYKWTVDGVSESTSNELTIDTSTLVKGGVYDIVLVAVKNYQNCSFMAQVKIN